MALTAVTEYLTAGEAALVLQISSQHVRNMAQAGRLKVAARTVGGMVLFLFADVERLKRERAKAERKTA